MRSVAYLIIGGMLACVGGAAPAWAQLNTQHIKGVTGLKAGSQPPPHWYFIAPLLYWYNTDTVRDSTGDKLPLHASINSVAWAGGLTEVTTKKLFGGYYSFQILFPAAVNNRLQGIEIDENPGPGLTDSAIVPISLGWHFKRADAIGSYTIFLPTGRYTDGADDNTGFGMWGHEISGGTTIYLDEAKQYHASTLVSLDFQSKKRNSETKVGNTMNLEGGVGRDFLHGGVTAGLVYYTTFKLSNDRISGITFSQKNKTFALGPELSLAIAANNTIYGFVKVNYQWEVYARNGTQGGELSILATFPYGPIKIPK